MRGATLGDAIKDRQVPCSTPGCTRTWTWKGSEQFATWLQPGGREPPSRMCEVCFEAKADFPDLEVPCARAGCDGTWTFARAERLAAWKRKQEKPPERLCASCQARRSEVHDVERPCRVKGCQKTFTWPRDAQLKAGAPFAEPKPPEGLCEDHGKQLRQASDVEVACRTPGCKRRWTWMRWQQLEASTREPPARYCEVCFGRFRAVQDQTFPCRVRGCTNQWTWSKVAQVKAWIEAGEKDPAVPERMCNRCSELVAKLKDEDVPCRIRSCKGTWRLPRGAQLERAVKNQKTPRRLCGGCASDLAKLADREEPCKNLGCTRTWTWTRTAQLIATRRHGAGTPPSPKRACEACEQFVKTHPPIEVPCVGCGAGIHWPSIAQLMSSFGKWVKPTRCTSCAAKGVPSPETVIVQPTEPVEAREPAPFDGAGISHPPTSSPSGSATSES